MAWALLIWSVGVWRCLFTNNVIAHAFFCLMCKIGLDVNSATDAMIKPTYDSYNLELLSGKYVMNNI